MKKRKVTEFDGKVGNNIIEAKMALSSVRNLRAEILKMAFTLAREKGINGCLVLIDPVIKENSY